MKQVKLFLLALFLIFSTNISKAQFAGGDGTSGNPYQIITALQLNEVRNHLSSYFILNNDIDLADFLSETGSGYNVGEFWQPIYNFTGNFDGNNHKIFNLKINRPTTNNIGLFGTSTNAVISNLGVETDAV